MADNISIPAAVIASIGAISLSLAGWIGTMLFSIHTTVTEMRRDSHYINQHVVAIQTRVGVIEEEMNILRRHDILISQLEDKLRLRGEQ